MKRQHVAIGFAAIAILNAIALPLSAQTIERTVTLKAIKAKTNCLDCLDRLVITNELPDFYVVPSIDGRQLDRSRVISESIQPTFNHTVSTKVAMSKNRIPIALKLMDNDTPPNADEIADISPLSDQKVLTMSYEPSTKAIYGPDNRKLGELGQAITVKGNKDRFGGEVEITFSISHKDTATSSSQPPSDPSCPVASTNCQPK